MVFQKKVSDNQNELAFYLDWYCHLVLVSPCCISAQSNFDQTLID